MASPNGSDFSSPECKLVKTHELRLGMYVKLEMSWLKHPFARKEFKITSENEIETMKRYGIEEVIVDFSRSDVTASDPKFSEGSSSAADKSKEEPTDTQVEDVTLKERILQKKKLLEQSKNIYIKSREKIENIFSETVVDPSAGINNSRRLIEDMSLQVSENPETFVHLITLKFKREFIQFHSLNVCVISLILGRTLKLQASDMKVLGIGALFHDIGKRSLPEQLITKKSRYTPLEKSIVMTHSQRGRDLLSKATDIPEKVITIAHQHHEHNDGSGFPRGLKDKYIDGLAKIVAVANTYENLTNPFNVEEMMLPHQALSYMYKNMKDKLPSILVENLVKSMGVYPPGSLVELDDGRIGVVISINKRSTMKPTVILFEKNVSKKNPLLIDLSQERSCKIKRALQVYELSDEAKEYLEPGKLKGYSTGVASEEPSPEQEEMTQSTTAA